jgi:hypothetical protein
MGQAAAISCMINGCSIGLADRLPNFIQGSPTEPEVCLFLF